ncbi:molecular chaperone DnaJ [Actinobaculum suis]|uniref:Chaperone protein DnaJ n=1 Tax=Actinobaculum suis TaxID=1657 RepID=A0A0K9EU88_9ACTO|nr:molecular chaperone DnaJ [Actinobaculum suis]KMY23430.1 molecular chaperone DnaJ [Actinobaculum suis]MDY5153179.1 molecular chaperone DnaJ [Actinobaculum suis]SDE64862.1 molecular chaperone DnaJ [Actinobaculum suis]
MDYYETLGVARDASQDEIRKAYLRLSRKLHPDHAGPEKAEEYKAVNEAYTVLSNEESRRKYDMGGSAQGGGFDFGMGDIFNTFFGGMGGMGGASSSRGPAPRGQRGQDSLLRISVELKDVIFGSERDIDTTLYVRCHTCEGDGCAPGTEPITCTNCHGAGMVQRVSNSLFGQMITQAPCPECEGHGTIIASPCPDCGAEGRVREKKTIHVKIPAGMESGMQLRFSNEGDAGRQGGGYGDLYVEVTVKEDRIYQRSGSDLLAEVQIPMTSAALGATITVPTFDGEQELEIPAGTNSGTVLTMKGLGVTRMNGKDRGNIRMTVAVTTPRDLDSQQRELLEQLATLRGESFTDAEMSSGDQSFFSKLKERFANR